MKRNRLLHNQTDSDPMGTVANLFDVAMVFAVALMVALVTRFNMTEMFSKEDFTMVKNPGKENMEIITKEGQEIKRYTPSEEQETWCSLPTGKWRNYLCSGIMIDIRHPLNKS